MNDVERIHVYNTYNLIADHFSSTRHYLWPNVKRYIDLIEPGSLIADIGCGNGKNMCRSDCEYIGLDFCDKFVKICREKGKNVVLGNSLNIPFASNLFDYTLSIAVIHHLSTYERRLRCINELIRITKPGGKIFIQVWGFSCKRSDKQNAMIEWNLQKKYTNEGKRNIKINRYYYLFMDDELKEMIPNDKVKILKYYESYNNWIAELIKL